MTKEQKIAAFDPSQPAQTDANLFGLPFTAEESEIIIIPVPWEVTVSYGSGASAGPEAVFEASLQVDLLHQEFPDLWKLGIFMDEAPIHWGNRGEEYKLKAAPIIQALENGDVIEENSSLLADLKAVNGACYELKNEIAEKTSYWLSRGKKVILLGGDHSTPLGYYEALASVHDSFGILHLDAHMDLRKAYEGFTYSHASIMYNALQIPQVAKLVQVAIRDFCDEEYQVVQSQSERVSVFTDRDVKANAFEGMTWREQCDAIIALLPQKVCVSFDIDALIPFYCPNTGTPVPGGLSFEQATYLLSRLANSGKEIIGIDLVEVAPGEHDDWDGNVGSRILFHLCGVLAKSQKMDVGEAYKFN
jgi:agmatinase